MPVQFQNYEFRYGEKPIFAPTELGRRIGKDIKEQVERAYQFDDFIYHFQKPGGHVAALHAHRQHEFFARADIRRFFYSIARPRLRRALSSIGIDRALHYAKCSCVKNPHGQPAYALPYGFVQSPILATLVLMKSGVGGFLRSLMAEGRVLVTVYMDDISLSSNSLSRLQEAFGELITRLAEAEFHISLPKTRDPGSTMDLFNCDMKRGHTVVRDKRVELFKSQDRSAASLQGFEQYCESVKAGNA